MNNCSFANLAHLQPFVLIYSQRNYSPLPLLKDHCQTQGISSISPLLPRSILVILLLPS